MPSWESRGLCHIAGLLALLAITLVVTAVLSSGLGWSGTMLRRMALAAGWPAWLAAASGTVPLIPGVLLGLEAYRRIAALAWPTPARWPDLAVMSLPLLGLFAVFHHAVQTGASRSDQAMLGWMVLALVLTLPVSIWAHRRAQHRAEAQTIARFD